MRIKKSWRFILGAAIGAGVGYAIVLLLQPFPRRGRRWRVVYQAPREERQEQPAG